MKLFISHTGSDREMLAALAKLINSIFGDRIRIRASTSVDGVEAVEPGDNWLEWIDEQVRTSDKTLVILTPDSVVRPWVIFEAGAVAGVDIAREKGGSIIPLTYRVRAEDLPASLSTLQATAGEEDQSVRSLLKSLNGGGGKKIYPDHALNVLLDNQVPAYIAEIEEALAAKPVPLTEDRVQEWLSRLEQLRDRPAEAVHIEHAIRIAHGSQGDLQTPFDLRIHRTLGEMYLMAKNLPDAIRQFKLAVGLSDRDIYLRHKLGLAELEAVNIPGAEEQLAKIEELDSRLPESNPEIAGFRGRLFREKWKNDPGDMDLLRKARASYHRCLKLRPWSYYMADNVGQLSLLLNDLPTAEEAFTQSRKILEGNASRGQWELASLATAQLATGARAEAMETLSQIRQLRPPPPPRVIGSIAKGLERLKEGLGASDEDLKLWKDALGPEV